MEKFSHLIVEAVKNCNWKPVKSSQGGPFVSHLFFADDLILFAEATPHQALIMKQFVNFEKSAIYCSPNISKDLAYDISHICGSPLTNNLGMYLGMPLLHSRVTKTTYNNLGGSDKKTKVHLCQWDLLCRPKSKGGLGFKKTHDMKKALLAKSGWRLLKKDEGLWAQIFEKKYLKGHSPTLIHMVEVSPDSSMDTLVSDFFMDGWWDIDKLRGVLLEDWVQKIIGCPADFGGTLEDCQIWQSTSNGLFSVKTAYNLLFSGMEFFSSSGWLIKEKSCPMSSVPVGFS
ncbi:unnamed protein product, partial [Prunus brigantina]